MAGDGGPGLRDRSLEDASGDLIRKVSAEDERMHVAGEILRDDRLRIAFDDSKLAGGDLFGEGALIDGSSGSKAS